MKTQLTFPNSFHVFCRSKNIDQKILQVGGGTYLVERHDNQLNFYLFTHLTFFFQVEKKIWDSGEFAKIFRIKISEVKQ